MMDTFLYKHDGSVDPNYTTIVGRELEAFVITNGEFPVSATDFDIEGEEE